MHSYAFVFFTVTLVAASATSAICLASPSARSAFQIFSSFIYFGIEDGPYYWTVKCLETAFAEMVGDICSEMNEPLELNVDLLVALDSKTILGRLFQFFFNYASHLATFFPPFLNQATVFTLAVAFAIIVICMILFHLNALHSEASLAIEVFIQHQVLVTQQNVILKKRLVSANVRLAELQFKAESHHTLQMDIKTPDTGFNAMREVLRSSNKCIRALKARNTDLEARLRVPVPVTQPSALQPPPSIDSKFPGPVLTHLEMLSSGHILEEASSIPPIPATTIKTTRIPLLTASTANATTSSIDRARQQASSKSPLRTANKYRSSQQLRSPAKSGTQSTRSLPLKQRRSVFAIGMRTPECVFKGKVHAKVSRNTESESELGFARAMARNGDGKENGGPPPIIMARVAAVDDVE